MCGSWFEMAEYIARRLSYADRLIMSSFGVEKQIIFSMMV